MRYVLLFAAAIAAPLAAQTTPAATGKPTEIPFVSFGSIWDWSADGDRGIYLENEGRHWYYAKLFGPCINLPFATRIAVDTGFAGDSLDSTGAILVDGQRCQIAKLVESGPPPKHVEKNKG